MTRLRLALGLLTIVSACSVGQPTDDLTAGAALGDQDKAPPESAHACIPGNTVQGVDVSYYEGTVNWTKAHAAGIEFAFIRVSDGLTFHDPKFSVNWQATKAAGVIRGAYQFFRPSDDPTEQADLVVAALGGVYTPGDLPPVIDVEVTQGYGPKALAAKVRTWVARVKSKLGVNPIIYTGTYFWADQVGGPTDFGGDPMWLARYTSCPAVTAPWTTWTFWQYTDSGHFAGISGGVDSNRFNGTLDQLKAFAGGSSVSAGATSCQSETMNTELDAGTCVQSDTDEQWYQCDAGAWVSIAATDVDSCPAAYGWCASATLGRDVAPRTCVQSASDQQWYQCDGHGWVAPVDPDAGTGPAGECSTSYPR
jgi:GH25 family lysozyme M1 (1,4-beta-N-acetylmuramidase)|nr:GH25 family lysozyme [Kofleriaceae bacterium]